MILSATFPQQQIENLTPNFSKTFAALLRHQEHHAHSSLNFFKVLAGTKCPYVFRSISIDFYILRTRDVQDILDTYTPIPPRRTIGPGGAVGI